MKAHGITAILLPLVLACAAGADTLRLAEDDTLHGTLSDLSEGAAVFNSTIAGTIIAPQNEIRGITTEHSARIVLKDGRSFYGQLHTINKTLHIVPDSGAEAVPIQVADLEAVNPAAKPNDEAAAQDKKSLFDMAVEAGVLARSGTRDTVEPVVGIRTEWEGPQTDLDGDLTLSLSGEDEFPRYARGEISIARTGDRVWEPMLQLEIDRDRPEGLDARVAATGGVGRDMIDTERTQLRLEAGLGASAAWHDAADLHAGEDWKWDLYYWGRDDTGSEEEIESRVNLLWEQAIGRRVSLSSRLSLYPSLSSFGDVRARSESALEWILTDRFSLRFDVLLDYENDPFWAEQDNFRSSLGAGVTVNF